MTENTPQHPRLHPDVLLHESEGMTLLLNFDQGHFFALDEIAARMVNGLLEQGAEATVNEIAQEFHVQPGIVATDCHNLQQELETSGLLERVSHAKKTFLRPLMTVPKVGFRKLLQRSVRRCVRRLRANSINDSLPPRTVQKLGRLVWLTLRCYGWRDALTFWLSFPLQNSTKVPEDVAVRLVDEQTRQTAARSLLFPMECKERALLGQFLLRVFGVESELIVGVQHAPFLAHAWVEVQGQIITDSASHCLLYEPAAAFVSNSADPIKRRATRTALTPLTAPVV